MKKKFSTKRSLIASILVLCLCITSLAGTTFAWFTDAVSSNNNIIKSGRLDVEMEYATVKDGQISGWSTVEKADKIFDPNALWEPGRVEVVYLKVSNRGNLALKYQLAVNVTDEDPGTNVYGDPFKLSEHLVFKVVEMPDALTTYTDREAVATAAGTEMGLKDHNGKTTALEVGDVDYVALIVYMPESVGNVANYRGDAVPTIKLGVNLYATQKMTEEDSFGPDYDEDAWHEKFTVSTAEDLHTALANVKDGDVIEFASNITFTKDNAGYNNGTYVDGVRYVGDKSFTIDFNGYTLEGNEDVNDYLFYLNNKGEKPNEITLKNGTLVAKDGCWATLCVNSAASTQATVLNMEGMSVTNSNDASYSGNEAVRARNMTTVNVNEGTTIISDGASYGVAASAADAIVNINNGATVIQKNSGSTSGNSVFAAVGGVGTVNINDGATIISDKYGVHTMTTGTPVMNVKGGTITADVALMASTNGGAGQLATINVTGGVINGKLETASSNGHIVVSAGTFSADPSAYVVDGFKAVQTNGMYVIVSDSIDGVASTPAEMAAAIAQGGVVYVAADIDMGNAWTSVKPNGELTILGNGNTITNLNLPLLTGGVSTKVTIKDLTVADSNVAPAANENGLGTGAFIPYVDAYGNVAIENCHLVNITVTGNKRAGGFIGYTSGQTVTIKDSSVEGCTMTAVGGAGAMIGYSQSVITIENSSVKNCTLTATEDRLGTEAPLAGAVVGTVNANATFTDVTVFNNTVNNNNATPIFSNMIGRRVSGTVIVNNATVYTPATIQAALDAAKPGDAFQLAAGTYDTLVIKNFWGGNYTQTGVTPITIKGGEGVVVGAIDLNGMNFVNIEDITFDAAKAVQVYAVSASNGYGNIVDSANAESQLRGVNHITIKNCVFTGTPATIARDSYEYCPINFMGRNTSSWTYNIVVSGCKFLTDAWNFIRINNVTYNGKVVIENNIFGGEEYVGHHHAINASANGGDWEIKGNTFINWNPEKCAFATGRSSETEVTDFVITGNTFINTKVPGTGDDGLLEIKTNSYTTANHTLEFSGNTFGGALEGLNENTIKVTKP